MRFLIDTQALLWWLVDSDALGPKARRVIMADTPVVSPVVLWEIAIKSGLGKLGADVGEVSTAIASDGFERVGLTDANMIEVSQLEHHHRDPFDRMLIAQARCDGVPILSSDQKFRLYEVDLLDARI